MSTRFMKTRMKEEQTVRLSRERMSAQSLQHIEDEQVEPVLSSDPIKRFKQIVYLLLNDYESYLIGLIFSLVSIVIIAVDISFLIIETEQSTSMPYLWVTMNQGITPYFIIEYLFRLYSYDAFEETFKEFIKSIFYPQKEPLNIVDLVTLLYCSFEILLYWSTIDIPEQVKVFRMLIVLRLARIFSYSTFQKGISILLRGLSESLHALSLLLFFTMICVILISSFMYFAEKELGSDPLINNIPEAIWWCIITITTVGYGDYVPKTTLGKFIGSLSLIFGVLLLSLPVAIIGNKFQEIYQQNKKQSTKIQREKAKLHYAHCKNQDEQEIYRIILRLNELEEVNERIEECLQDNQFLYRSISRDAQNMINKIELTNGKTVQKRDSISERISRIKEQIANNR